MDLNNPDTPELTQAIEVMGNALSQQYGEWSKVTLISMLAAIGRRDRVIMVLPTEFIKFAGANQTKDSIQAFTATVREVSDVAKDRAEKMEAARVCIQREDYEGAWNALYDPHGEIELAG